MIACGGFTLGDGGSPLGGRGGGATDGGLHTDGRLYGSR